MNVYAEELTDRIEIIEKVIDGQTFTGLRMYMYLPVTVKEEYPPFSRLIETRQVQGPFIHGENDDDSAAITFWGKSDMRIILAKALDMLNEHYQKRG